MSENRPLVEVKNLKQYFPAEKGKVVKAVDGVSFKIERGETFGLVGESGSGKSTIGRSVIRLYNPTSGEIYFNNQDISGKLTAAQETELRQKMQMIFQDPMASLNPRKKVIDIVAQGLDVHHLYSSKKEREEKVVQILEKVGLSREHLDRYPHQFSGGQRQRIGIARALILNPDLIIADEAISALDISIQAQVINLLNELSEKMGLTIMFIAHDLAVVKYFSNRIAVMYYGKIVELGTSDELFAHPFHPYTRSLLSAIPLPDPITEKSRKRIEYKPVLDHDYSKEGPTMREVYPGHFVLCNTEEFEKYRREYEETAK